MHTETKDLTDSPPIEITTEGITVSRLKISNPTGFAVIIKANHVTLQECDISGAVNIFGAVHGIVMQNNYIHDVKPEGDKDYAKNFAGITTTECAFAGNPFHQPSGAYDIIVRGNYFENCPTGTYLVGCKGPITFRGNYSSNHFGPFPRGQMVQLALCDGSTGPISIENNFSYVNADNPVQVGHAATGTGVEDHINCYNSCGSESYPITIRNNFIIGCSDSLSGSGIMLGDSGGSYYQILNNRVYNTGNAGIGICGGHHWLMKGNRIYQNPPSPHYWSKGMQIVKFGDDFSSPVVVDDNLVYWQCGKGDGSLWCTETELVEFRRNTFGNEEVFGMPDALPPHEPPEPVEGLMKPWLTLNRETSNNKAGINIPKGE